MALLPSESAYVPFVSVQKMMDLVNHIGVEQVLTDLAAEIEADFRRCQIGTRWSLTINVLGNIKSMEPAR